MKQRLDKLMLARGLVNSRSEAENWIRLGRVRVDGRVAAKPGLFVDESASIELALPGTCAAIRPESMTSTEPARAAACGSWVTIRKVAPSAAIIHFTPHFDRAIMKLTEKGGL